MFWIGVLVGFLAGAGLVAGVGAIYWLHVARNILGWWNDETL
jgi:hypothetical protein